MLVDKLAANADEIIIAGDDKQSIMTFSAADVDTFLHVPGKVETLEQSYRTPKRVWKLANKIMGRMLKYRPEGTQWVPQKEEGDVRRVNSIPYTSLAKGDWLVLTRTNYILEKIAVRIMQTINDVYTKSIIPFTINGVPPFDTDIYILLDLYARAIKENKLIVDLLEVKETDVGAIAFKKRDTIKRIKKFLELSTNKYDSTITDEMRKLLNQPWYKAINIDPITLRYIAEAYKKHKTNPNMFKDAPLRLMTIHAAKGREADNVVLVLDVPQAVRDTMMEDNDDSEVKNLYVGVTRAKKRLYLVNLDKNKRGLEYYII